MARKLILSQWMHWLLTFCLFFVVVSCGLPDAPSISALETQSRQEWVFTFNGTGNSSDIADALAVDSAGNAYLTGVARMGGSTTAFNDYVTVKVNANGGQVWSATYNGAGNDFDDANGVAVASSGNVFVTGFCRSGTTASTNDYCTVAYNSSGTELWNTVRNGAGNNTDNALAIGVDSSGNPYVTGTCRSGATSTTQDYCTVKYNGTTGAETWATVTDGTGANLDEALALAVDDTNGRIYVTGRSTGVGSGTDYMTVSFNSSTGAEVWNTRFNGSGNTTDIARAITFDSSGNVYVTGEATTGTGTDIVTVKYNSAGVQQWSAAFNGAGSTSDDGRAIAVDGSGNVYVTGGAQSAGTSTSRDFATIKYDSNGNQLWSALFNGTGADADRGRGIAVDSGGNVYVTGQSTGVGSGTDLASVKYNSAGSQLWVQRFNGAGNSTDDSFVMAIREASPASIYVAGDVTGSASGLDYVVVLYTQPGACGF